MPSTSDSGFAPLKTPQVATRVLAKTQADREIVQEYCPLADSLEWQLGQFYFRSRGNKAFVSDAIPVPFIINNDGTLSRNAAELFFSSCLTDDLAGSLEAELFVLEIGIGVGLFARFFLDHFRDLCRREKKDYYDRLCYVVADRSEKMLMDFLRHGLMADHPGRYRARALDATEPDRSLPMDVMFAGKQKPFRAVFLNYLLDCLPAAVLDVSGSETRQLCVQTCVARNVTLKDHTDMSLKSIQARAKKMDDVARDELMEIYGLFASEYDYRTLGVDKIPYGQFGVEFARVHGKRIMHNYGAIQCLERLLTMVLPQGFILMNEYGQARIGHDDDHEHQRFSFATAVGLNFPLLKSYFGKTGEFKWVEPPQGEGRGIETRLLGHRFSHEMVVRFYELFQPAAYHRLDEPVKKARACVEHGRYELAATYYREAIELQPQNWFLLGEISNFMTFQLADPRGGADLAKIALRLNPVCSSELWNALGDALFAFDRNEEALSAYEKAATVNSSDLRSRFGMACVFNRQKKYEASLAQIAAALALDKMGQYRELILQKQTEVISRLAHRHQKELLLHINFVSHDSQFLRHKDQKKGVSPESTMPASE